MIMRLSTVLSVASLIAMFADAPGAAAEWATKEEAQTRFLEGVGRVRRPCPRWVKSGHLRCINPCPLYPPKATSKCDICNVR